MLKRPWLCILATKAHISQAGKSFTEPPDCILGTAVLGIILDAIWQSAYIPQIFSLELKLLFFSNWYLDWVDTYDVLCRFCFVLAR